LQTWITEGIPAVFWLPGFYFTQSFLTGTLQNYARKYKLAIDTLGWEFQMLREARDDMAARAEDGCYIDGLFFDGAGWNKADNVLAEQDPKVRARRRFSEKEKEKENENENENEKERGASLLRSSRSNSKRCLFAMLNLY
jgi:hypothetical protein